MAKITMADKARFYEHKAAKARAKAAASLILLKLVKTATLAYPVAHPKVQVMA